MRLRWRRMGEGGEGCCRLLDEVWGYRNLLNGGRGVSDGVGVRPEHRREVVL
jgi:hypothetical protein